MQRSTLLPLADYMAGKDAASMQALEVGAGTGRFATFVKDNYPSLQLTLADLSPFYLAEARSNMRVSGGQGGGKQRVARIARRPEIQHSCCSCTSLRLRTLSTALMPPTHRPHSTGSGNGRPTRSWAAPTGRGWRTCR